LNLNLEFCEIQTNAMHACLQQCYRSILYVHMSSVQKE